MMICLLWDFDNTLAYSDGKWTRSLCNILKDNGYPDIDEAVISQEFKTGLPWNYPQKAHHEYFGEKTWWEFVDNKISNILYKIGISGSENILLAKKFKPEYLKLSRWHLFDDTLMALDNSLKFDIMNVILSNHVPELLDLTDYLCITKYFIKIWSSANIGVEKPNMEAFNIVQNSVKADRYIMIGDNYFADVTGGLHAGMEAILVRSENIYGYTKYSKDLSGIWEYI